MLRYCSPWLEKAFLVVTIVEKYGWETMYILFLSLFLPECFKNTYFTSLKETTMSINNKLLVTITPLLVLAGKVFARGTRSRTSGLGRVWRRRCENRRSLGKFFATLENQACGPVEKKTDILDLAQQKTPQAFYRLVATCKQTCQFHLVATSLLKSGLSQLVICRLVTTC